MPLPYQPKKPKVLYYAHNILRQAVPGVIYRSALERRLRAINDLMPERVQQINDRVNYYNKLQKRTPLNGEGIALNDMPIFKSPKAYNFDTFEITRYFPRDLKANFLFGDVTHVAAVPSIQKSRPVNGDNSNAVLLKLDKYRHFNFVNDKVPFEEKKDMLIGRGVMTQPHRIAFMERYFDDPLCDLGQVNKAGGDPKWVKPKIGIKEHLAYKFILSLEGNDVATNLKWIMSSNSVAVMPKPKYETWFMEGRLIADHHYIEIRDDHADLHEKLNHYIKHPNEAIDITKNANAFVKQFTDSKQEDLISLLVLQKYFKYTGQADE